MWHPYRRLSACVDLSRAVEATIEPLEPRRLLSATFYLIDADHDTRLFEITPGQIIDRSKLATGNLSIEASVPSNVAQASARVAFDNQTRKDNSKPFSAFGDDGVDYAAGSIALGWHLVSVTPFSKKSCAGKQGETSNLLFKITDSTKTAVSSLWLVDAVHDKRLIEIKNGSTIDLAQLPTRRVNIEAATSPSKVGSVQLGYDLEDTVNDNAKPYAAFGDNAGDFAERHLTVGEHTLVAQSFSGASGTGKAAAAKTIHFEVIDTTTWGTITGTVYNDADGNGAQGASESGLAGREVLARTAAGKTVVATTTDADGYYEFQWPSDELTNGTVLVRVRDPQGWRTTQPTVGYRRVAITPQQITHDRNFGQTEQALVKGVAFIDTDGDGVRDSGEAVAANRKVWDDRNQNESIESNETSTTTASDGSYQLSLDAGDHYLMIYTGASWRVSEPQSIWQNIDLNAAEPQSSVNFGITQAWSAGIIPLFSWSVPARYGFDANNNGRTDLPNTSAYANPSEGYTLNLNGKISMIDPSHGAITKYRWQLDSSSIPGFTPMVTTGATPSFPYLQQGKFSVTLKVTTADGKSSSLTQPVQVRDILIVSLGDSYGSGEGVPDKIKTASSDALWADGLTDAMNTENREAHRSTKCASSLAAIRLEESSPHFSVTYVHLAASGAEVKNVINTWKDGIENTSYQLKPQLQELKDVIGKRQIDILNLSAGGNNVGFGDMIRDFVLHFDGATSTQEKTVNIFGANVVYAVIKRSHLSFWSSIADIVATAQQKMASLPQAYADLQNAIKASFTVKNTLITEYSDPTHDQNGNVAAFGGDILKLTLVVPGVEATQVFIPPSPPLVYPTTFDISSIIDAAESQAIGSSILAPLNQAVANAAAAQGWQYIGNIASDFSRHGYASTDHWYTTMDEARAQQGIVGDPFKFDLFGFHLDYSISPGGAHPNAAGYAAIANRIYPRLSSDVDALLAE